MSSITINNNNNNNDNIIIIMIITIIIIIIINLFELVTREFELALLNFNSYI